MTTPATQLRLTHPNPAHDRRFDHRAWQWALRDSGWLAQLTHTELQLITLCSTLADTHGQFDLSARWAAAQLQRTDRIITKARTALISRSLITPIGKSKTHAHVPRYALVTPLTYSPTPPTSTPTPERTFSPPRTHVQPGGERQNPQSVPSKAIQSKRQQCAPSPLPPHVPAQSHASPGLFEKPEYAAAAVKILVKHGKLSERQAHGLVTQYRPTVEQVRAIVANMAALHRARGVDNPAGFMVSALRRGDWGHDARVLKLQDRSREKTRARLSRRQRQAHRQTQQIQQQNTQAQRDAIWASLTHQDKARLRQQVIDDAPEILRASYSRMSMTHPNIRAGIITLAKQEQQSS